MTESGRGDRDEPAAIVQDGAAAQLVRELRRREVALVHLELPTAVEHTPLAALDRLLVGTPCGVDDDQPRCDPARLGEELLALGLIEVAVEVAGEDPIERGVREGKVRASPKTKRAAGIRSRAIASIPPL